MITEVYSFLIVLTEHCGYHDNDGDESNLTDDFEEVTPPVPPILAATPIKLSPRIPILKKCHLIFLNTTFGWVVELS